MNPSAPLEATEAPHSAPPARPARTGRGWWIAILILLVLGIAGAYRWRMTRPAESTQPNHGAAARNRSVPVLAAEGTKQDLPIYLDGLGTVAAFNTVTVRSRVEGILVKVAFTEGQAVAAGDVLAEIDPRPYQAELSARQAAVAQAQAQVELANITVKHLKQMNSEMSASETENEEASAALDQANALLAGAKANEDSAQLNLEWCQIVAPISGRIGLRLVDQGNLVHINEPAGVAVITQLKPISVLFNLPQEALPRVMAAMANDSPLSAEAYSSDFRTRLAVGQLLAVDNQIDVGTGTARFKAKFENEDNRLFPNQFVNVRLLVDRVTNAIVVPAAAIQRNPQFTYVFVIKADQTVELRDVTVGPSEGGQTVVTQGLEAGEVVVTDGVDKLIPGMSVNIRQENERTSQPASQPASGPAASAPHERRGRDAGSNRPRQGKP